MHGCAYSEVTHSVERSPIKETEAIHTIKTKDSTQFEAIHTVKLQAQQKLKP